MLNKEQENRVGWRMWQHFGTTTPKRTLGIYWVDAWFFYKHLNPKSLHLFKQIWEGTK